MKKFYFTCGQNHQHIVGSGRLARIWDKDSVIMVIASNRDKAREFVFDKFGNKWSFDYTEDELDLSYFPKGIIWGFEVNNPIEQLKERHSSPLE